MDGERVDLKRLTGDEGEPSKDFTVDRFSKVLPLATFLSATIGMAEMRRLLWHLYGAVTISVLFLSAIHLSECLKANYEMSWLEIGISVLGAFAGFFGTVHYATRLRHRYD